MVQVRRRSGLFVVLFGGSALALGASVASCREPTQVTVTITTDVPCSQLRGMTITVGHLGEIETKDPALNSTFCDENGNLGTLVVEPSGEDDEQVAIRAIAGNGKDPEQCVAPAYGPQCIVARRALDTTVGFAVGIVVLDFAVSLTLALSLDALFLAQ